MTLARSYLDIARVIRAERRRRGWTQADLAWHSGVAEKHISRIENVANEARISTVLRVLHALQVTVDLLDEEEMAKRPLLKTEDYF